MSRFSISSLSLLVNPKRVCRVSVSNTNTYERLITTLL